MDLRTDKEDVGMSEQEYLRDLLEISTLLTDYFRDVKKAIMWLDTENPLLGGVTPRSMIYVGRTQKLLSFMHQQLQGIHP